MANRYCQVPNHIWHDGTMAGLYNREEKLDPFDDLPPEDLIVPISIAVYFHLLTCQQGNVAGIFPIDPSSVARLLRISRQTLRAAIQRLEAGGLIIFDPETMLIMVVHQLRHEQVCSERQKKGVENCIRSGQFGKLGEIRLQELATDTLSIPYRYPIDTLSVETTHLKTTADTLSIPNRSGTGTGTDSGTGTETVSEADSETGISNIAPQIEWPPDEEEHDAPSEHTPNEPSEIKGQEEQKQKRTSRKDQKARAEAYAQAVTAYWEQNQEELKGYAPNRDYDNFIPQVEGWCYAKPANAAKKSTKETHLKAFIKNWLQGMPEIKPSYLPQNREKWALHAMALHRAVVEYWDQHGDELKKHYPQRDYKVTKGDLEAWILNNHEKMMRHDATEDGALRLWEKFLSGAKVLPEWGIGTDPDEQTAELEDRYRYAELQRYKINRSEADRDLDIIAHGDSLGGPEYLSGVDAEEYQAASRRVRLAKEYCAKYNRPLPFTREGISGNAEWDSEAMREHRRGIQAVIASSLGPDQKAMPGVLTRDQQEAATCQK